MEYTIQHDNQVISEGRERERQTKRKKSDPEAPKWTKWVINIA